MNATRPELATYIKLVAVLEAEREAVTMQIEAEKNAARQRFNQVLGQEIFEIIIKSPGGQQILSDVRETIDGLRQAAETVKAALGDGPPSQQLLDLIKQNVDNAALVQNTVQQLGSDLGHKVDQALGGLLSHLDMAAANIKQGMDQAIAQADEMDGVVAGYQEEDRTPGNTSFGDRIRNADGPLDAAVEALATASFIAASIRPDDGTKDTMRDRVRDILMTQRHNRRDQLLNSNLPGLVRCVGVDEATYQSVATQLGLAIEKPADPITAKFVVCRYTDTDEYATAFMVGQALVEAEPTPEEESQDEGESEDPPSEDPPPAEQPPLMVDPVTDKVFNDTFTGPAICGEKEEYPYGWSVSLIQDDDGNVAGTIRFHACPNGGQAVYRVVGEVSAEMPDTIILQGTKREGWGTLDGTTPEQQQFTFTIGLPPSPNFGS
jgi:hypothetical protein